MSLALFALVLPALGAIDEATEEAELRAKADAGDEQALLQLAQWLEYGRGEEEGNAPAAVALYSKGAARGNHRAAFRLAMMYADGRGTAKKPALAMKWLKQAAEAGIEEAQYHLGLCYAEDGVLPRDDAEAFKWFRLAAEQQFSGAVYQVGHAYSLGLGVKRDTTEAARWLKLAVSLYESQAGEELDELVKAEPKLADVEAIPDRSVVAAAFAAKPAPPPAPVSPYGENLPAETLALIAKAEAGDALAERGLASGLVWGSGGLTVNRVKAAEWYRKSADRGNAESMNELAGLYAGSKGTDAAFAANPEEALRWFKKAAEGGHTGAAMHLGAAYDRGTDGVTVNQAESFKWYLAAATHGSEYGECSVGICYLAGSGVAADRAEGIKWLQKSAAHGNSYAKQQLERLGAAVVNPDAFKDSLAPLVRSFETAFNAAADLAARERAVVKFSVEVGTAGSKANATKEQLAEFVLTALQPMMARRPDEAGAYAMKIDGQVFDQAVLSRVLPANVLAAVRGYAKRVSEDYTAQQNFTDSIRPLLDSAKAGNASAQVQVAERYLQGAAGTYAESFRLKAVYWFKQAHNQGQKQHGARIDQLVAPYKKQLVAALDAKDGPAVLAICEAMGEAGYDTSAREAGIYLLEGCDGVTKNEGAARYWFKRGAELGNADAKLWSELLESNPDAAKKAEAAYANGEAAMNRELATQQFELSQPWYRFAASLGSQPAAGRLKEIAELAEVAKAAAAAGAKEFDEGLAAYNAKDFAKAMTSWKSAAEKGRAAAMFNIGVLYRNGQGVAASLATARDWYAKAAAKDPKTHRKALAEADDLIAHGEIELLDGQAAYGREAVAEARGLFQAAIAKGNVSALFWLGSMIADGAGGPRDLPAARDWLAQAAAKGATGAADRLKEVEAAIAGGGAELDLGLAAYEAKNFPEAFAQWRKGAAKGNLDAAFNLGVLHERGEGVPCDYAQAAAWYDQAAVAGHKDGKAAAERMRAALVGTDELAQGEAARKAKKYAEAVAWWEKSANLGNVNAMTVLGVFYMHGAGEIFGDSDKAEFWLKKAEAAGDESAGEYLKSVEMMAGLRAGLGETPTKAPPPQGPSLVKGSKWTADDVRAALQRGADHEALAVALRTDGIDYYHGEYLRLMRTPEAAKIVEFGHLSMALVDGYKAGAGAWAVEMAKAAIAARRSQLKLAPLPADSAELRARAKAGDAAALYALFVMRPEQLTLGDLPPELRFSYADFAQLMVAKNHAPGLWVAAGTLVNQVDKTRNDPVLRAEYLRRCAESGDARGAHAYGELFFAPGEVAVAPNFAEAERWFIEAGAREQPGDFSVMPPQLALTVLYSAQAPIGFSGTDLRPDDASLRWIRELLRRGGRTAEHAQLVLEAWRGASNPPPVDEMLKALPPEVAPWSAAEVASLETAAKKGDVAAALKLAAAYESGRGVRQHDARAVEWFLVAANQGSIPAMRALAAHSASGFGAKQSSPDRLAWLEKAGAAGDASAWREFGELFHWAGRESGIATDYPRALAAYEKAVAGGDLPVLLDLADIHGFGRGVPQDAAKSREYKLRAAEAGHAPARNLVARDFRDAKDFKNAALWYRKDVDAGANLPGALGELANALEKSGDAAGAIPVYREYLARQPGDFQSWYALGGLQEKQRDFAGALVSYQTVAANNSPYNFHKDPAATAVKRVQEELNPKPGGVVALRKQAEAGDAAAMVELAVQLTPTDKPAAFAWLKQAAAKDHPGALLWLGLETAASDKAAGLALVQKSATLGNLEAKFRVGAMQMQGQEMPLDQAKGLALVTESADGGFSAAQFELGKALITGGPGVPADPARGLAYLQKSALQGVPQAAAVLGEVYERGLGGSVSLTQAARWYQEAVRGGLKQAEPALQRVQQQLNAAAKR